MAHLRSLLRRALPQGAISRLTRAHLSLESWMNPSDPSIGLGLSRLW